MARVAIIGAGVAGLGCALSLQRRGHEVVVVERDAAEPPVRASDAPHWQRRGVPHFLQPHACLARGAKVLREDLPEVYAGLLDGGALELQIFQRIPEDQREPEDTDLVLLGCRRSLMEWVLRRLVEQTPGIELRSGAVVQGLSWAEGEPQLRATGVLLGDGTHVRADVVVDASGRSSQLTHWIVDAAGLVPEQSSDCGNVYYSRYYRFRDDRPMLEGPWLIGPRSDLVFLESGTFWGDNATFSVVQNVRASDRELKALRYEEAFTRSLRAQPTIAPLIAEELSEPITPVLSMGQLRNTRRRFVEDGRATALGVVAIGDALCHTNPRYAWGLSLALAQGVTLAELLDDHPATSEGLVLAFHDHTQEDADGAFEAAVATDEARARYAAGISGDIRDPENELMLFLLLVLPMAGLRDAGILRKAVRRLMLLDHPRLLERDRDLQQRGAAIVRAMQAAQPPPPPGPSRDELLELVRTAD